MNKLNPSYIGPRDDILEFVPEHTRRVLDIGCSIGSLGKRIKEKFAAEVVGIEIDVDMAKIAERSLDRIIIGDVEELKLEDYFRSGYFDCIICADVLEHLKNPWLALRNLATFLCKKGFVISSIPNVRHYTTIVQLALRGYWPYRDRGIHDKSHLRFFTLKNIEELFSDSGLEIVGLYEKYRLFERPHPFNRLSKCFAFPLLKKFIVFHYVVIAQKR